MKARLQFLICLYCYFYFADTCVFAQEVRHQMISSQGATKTTSTGIIINQTIGQQTVTGTVKCTEGIVVQQGFQQSFWSELLAESEATTINVTTFPNPFTESINFQFTTTIDTNITVSIFDINGRIVYTKTEKITDTTLTLDLPLLPVAQYLVKLSSSQLNYFTKIIKI